MMVVIVDDAHINLVLMSRLIGKLEGVETVSFQAARPALEWCNSHAWDLLIIDYMMPDMDGLALIAALAVAPAERPPVLMVTASTDVDVRHRAWRTAPATSSSSPSTRWSSWRARATC